MATMATDLVEIANLLKRERFYRDTGRWDLCRAAYHPDASRTRINVAWYEGDVDGFVEQSAKVHEGKVNIVHAPFDPADIQVHGHRATSDGFCVVSNSLTLNGVEFEFVCYMRLATRLEKLATDGQWRMLSLESIYIRDRLVPIAQDPDAESVLTMTDDVNKYPKAYRQLALIMLYRGLLPRPDLPNEDDQEGVRLVLEKNRAFLNGDKGEAIT